MRKLLAACAATLVAAAGITVATPAPIAQAASTPCPARSGKTLYKQSGFTSWAGKTLKGEYICVYKVNGTRKIAWYLTDTKSVTSHAYRAVPHNKYGGIIASMNWAKVTGNSGTYQASSFSAYTMWQFKVIAGGTHYYSYDFKLVI